MNPRKTTIQNPYNARATGITDPKFLYRHHQGSYTNGKYSQVLTDVYSGERYLLEVLFTATEVLTDDGRRGIYAGRGPRKSAIVRFYDNGMAEFLSPATEVTVVRQVEGGGLPLKGEFVKVLAGPEQGRIGIVLKPGTNSTYVHFIEGETPEKFKVKAREVQIVDVRVEVLS